MKELVELILFAVEFVSSVIATMADIVIKIFNPFSKGGHAVEHWCEKQRKKLMQPKKKEEPQT